MPRKKTVRHQVSVYLEQDLLQVAREQMAKSDESLSNVIVDAARQSLLKSYRDQREQEILKAVERNFYRLCRMEKVVCFDLFVLKEMLGLLLRTYLNHTPPVPESQWEAASRSGRVRFGQFLDMLAENIRRNRSILNDVATAPIPEPKSDSVDGTPAEISRDSQSHSPPSTLSKLDSRTESDQVTPPPSEPRSIRKTNKREQNNDADQDSSSSNGRLF